MEQQPPSDPAPAGELQFDRADFGEAQPAGSVQCSACNQAVAGAYWEINGAVACEGCQAKALAQRTGGSALARVIWATIFGTVAGAAGAGIYYGISALTGGWEFGLIAVLVGFMVGFAVSFGSQQRGGWFYQLLAVGLTYCSIVSTYIPPIAEELRQVSLVDVAAESPAEAAETDRDSGGSTSDQTGEIVGLFAEEAEPGEVFEPSPAEDSAAGALEEDGQAAVPAVPAAYPAAPAADEELELIVLSGAVFWIFVVAFAFVAPFLAGFENILGILIIGFGLWQAWQLNRKRPFEVSGPFQVAGARASS